MIEIQGTGEERPFKKDELQKLLEIGEENILKIIAFQKNTLIK
jgi:ribonuclease PH